MISCVHLWKSGLSEFLKSLKRRGLDFFKKNFFVVVFLVFFLKVFHPRNIFRFFLLLLFLLALKKKKNRKDSQMSQLTELETKFSSSQAAVRHIQERIKALEIAMQMARKVRCVPFLEQYCILNKVFVILTYILTDSSSHSICQIL